MHRPTAMLAITVAALLPVATVQAQQPAPLQPTLQFDHGCYTEDQDMPFSGTGYTPGGEVDLIFARDDLPRGVYTTHADATGALDDHTAVETADGLLDDDQDREPIFVSADDRTRADAGQQPPESQLELTHFTFTRWEGFSPGRYVPGKRATVEIYGWAFAAGKQAWFLFLKGSRTVASVEIGRLDDECGDLTATIKVPRRLKPGSYRVALTTDRNLRGPYTWRRARVTARGSTAARASRSSQAMARVTRLSTRAGAPDDSR